MLLAVGGGMMQALKVHSKDVNCLCLDPALGWLLSGGDDCRIGEAAGHCYLLLLSVTQV
jgi:hypothetical protein